MSSVAIGRLQNPEIWTFKNRADAQMQVADISSENDLLYADILSTEGAVARHLLVYHAVKN